MHERTTRMFLATAALASVAALLAGPANAYFVEGVDGHAVSAQSQVRQPAGSVEPGTIPYLSHGIGVDESLFAGQQPAVDDRVAATAAANVGLDPAIKTAIEARSDDASVAPASIPYLSQGIGVDESQFAGQASRPRLTGPHAALERNAAVTVLPHGVEYSLSSSARETQPLGLSGDSPLSRVAAPEPEGLIGDSAATRYPGTVSTVTASGDDEIDWTSFGAGAGMVALLAAGLGGVLLTMRKRHTVGLP